MNNEELAYMIQQGDSSVIFLLWDKVKAFLFSTAYRKYTANADMFKAYGIEFDDIKQVCWFAFLRALKYYNSESGYKFITYLYKPLLTEISNLTGRTKKKRCDPLNQAESIDEPITEDNYTIGDMIADDTATKFIDDLDAESEAQLLWETVKELPERQAAIIIERYRNGRTQKEIAELLNVSISNIQETERRALRALKTKPYIMAIQRERRYMMKKQSLEKHSFNTEIYAIARAVKCGY